MSAFIVEDTLIHTVLGHLYMTLRPSWGTPPSLGQIFIPEKQDGDAYKALSKIGQQMLAMNYTAVECRYEDRDGTNVVDLPAYRFVLKVGHVSAVQAFKSLRCFLYQCCEGRIPETSKLYKDLENLSNQWARSIVDSSDAYERASWG